MACMAHNMRAEISKTAKARNMIYVFLVLCCPKGCLQVCAKHIVFVDMMIGARYNAFLEQCVPSPRKYAALEKNIMEEVSAYYAGYRTAEAVAAQINNRVQAYLDEGD